MKLNHQRLADLVLERCPDARWYHPRADVSYFRINTCQVGFWHMPSLTYPYIDIRSVRRPEDIALARAVFSAWEQLSQQKPGG